MNDIERIFLEKGTTRNHNGDPTRLGISFTTEENLNDALWLHPDDAAKDLRFLLKVHGGEMTPSLHRLALKAVTIPLFQREFHGDDTPLSVETSVRAVPEQTSRLLDAYMDRVGDDQIDQNILDQAIDDTTVLHLVSRSLRSPETDDVILLPAGPETDQTALPTTFTLLRRKTIGRGLLHVSDVRQPLHMRHTPQAQPYRIQIHPSAMRTAAETRYDLAEALIAEQQAEILTTEEYDMIETADTYVHKTIANYFNRLT